MRVVVSGLFYQYPVKNLRAGMSISANVMFCKFCFCKGGVFNNVCFQMFCSVNVCINVVLTSDLL